MRGCKYPCSADKYIPTLVQAIVFYLWFPLNELFWFFVTFFRLHQHSICFLSFHFIFSLVFSEWIKFFFVFLSKDKNKKIHIKDATNISKVRRLILWSKKSVRTRSKQENPGKFAPKYLAVAPLAGCIDVKPRIEYKIWWKYSAKHYILQSHLSRGAWM